MGGWLGSTTAFMLISEAGKVVGGGEKAAQTGPGRARGPQERLKTLRLPEKQGPVHLVRFIVLPLLHAGS